MEQIIETLASSLAKKVFEVPTIRTQEKIIEECRIMQQVMNTDVQHVVNAVEVEVQISQRQVPTVEFT